MLERIPGAEELTELMGASLYDIWSKLCTLIEASYEMERLWNRPGKKWAYEYKYRRGGKTLCTLYAGENCLGLMIIFGKTEREKFEADRGDYSAVVQKVYDESDTYYDGKWMMFELADTALFPDVEKLLRIKRRPNRKG